MRVVAWMACVLLAGCIGEVPSPDLAAIDETARSEAQGRDAAAPTGVTWLRTWEHKFIVSGMECNNTDCSNGPDRVAWATASNGRLTRLTLSGDGPEGATLSIQCDPCGEIADVDFGPDFGWSMDIDVEPFTTISIELTPGPAEPRRLVDAAAFHLGVAETYVTSPPAPVVERREELAGVAGHCFLAQGGCAVPPGHDPPMVFHKGTHGVSFEVSWSDPTDRAMVFAARCEGPTGWGDCPFSTRLEGNSPLMADLPDASWPAGNVLFWLTAPEGVTAPIDFVIGLQLQERG